MLRTRNRLRDWQNAVWTFYRGGLLNKMEWRRDLRINIRAIEWIKRTKQTEYLAGDDGQKCFMLTTINYQPPSTNNSRAEWSGEWGEERRVFVIRRLYAKIRGRGNEPSQWRAGVVFDKLYLISHEDLWGKYKYSECNAASSVKRYFHHCPWCYVR